MIGTMLGRYRILEALGRGGMGEVYIAEDPMLARKLAIKVLPREFALDPERRTRLLHEARAASALNHPNIITVHDLGESEGTLFVAVELVDGATLREWAASAPRTPADVLRIARQATQALALAHGAGLVHRDLKPENLMVRRDGLLKILDFGLARSVSPGSIAQTTTLPGTVMGTAPYMSPEQVLGQPAGPASDIFSTGTILYELFTGKHPFAAGSPVETMHRILHETPEVPSRVNLALTPEFDFVLGKALSKDPRRRHSSMTDLDVDLETLECGCGPSPDLAEGGHKSPEPRTIAVLPFKNIGGDQELSYLGMGLADAVITRLSHSPDLIVRTTSSILAYENKPTDPRRVGQELDATAVLDASFQRAGDRFRATARLVESSTGRPLWAGKVDVRCDDIFDVQDQVAGGIAEALTARLSSGRSRRGADFTPSPEAYVLFMRGNESFRVFTDESVHDSILAHEKAVELEPRWAQAWIALAEKYHAMLDGGFDPDPAWYEKEERALVRAQELDPDLPELQFRWGALHLVRGRKREAYRALCNALAAMPNSALVHHYFAYLFRLSDMLDEAFAADLKAIELDPNVVWGYAAIAQIEALRSGADAGLHWIEKGFMRLGEGARNPRTRVTVLLWGGRTQEATELAEQLLSGATTLPGLSVPIWMAYALSSKRAPNVLSNMVQEGEAWGRVDMDAALGCATYYAIVGDRDLAFRHLQRAVELGNDMLRLYELPILGTLHDDPRWTPFIEGVRRRVAEYRREFRWPPA
jgi:serine/threonine protein kinase/tetratricopeptide (TPR) repeat protein